MSAAHDHTLTLIYGKLQDKLSQALVPVLGPHLTDELLLTTAHEICAYGERRPLLDSATGAVLGFEWRVVTMKATKHDEPRYPAGTPEHEAYTKELRAELTKFAAGEPPYDYKRP